MNVLCNIKEDPFNHFVFDAKYMTKQLTFTAFNYNLKVTSNGIMG